MNSLKNISEITTVILDVDGVLTDGRIGYHDNGDEIKFFHVRDGAVIKMAMRAGLRVGILSGRKSKANETRATELGMSFLKQACKNKADGLRELLQELLQELPQKLLLRELLQDLLCVRPEKAFALAALQSIPPQVTHITAANKVDINFFIKSLLLKLAILL